MLIFSVFRFEIFPELKDFEDCEDVDNEMDSVMDAESLADGLMILQIFESFKTIPKTFVNVSLIRFLLFFLFIFLFFLLCGF